MKKAVLGPETEFFVIRSLHLSIVGKFLVLSLKFCVVMAGPTTHSYRSIIHIFGSQDCSKTNAVSSRLLSPFDYATNALTALEQFTRSIFLQGFNRRLRAVLARESDLRDPPY